MEISEITVKCEGYVQCKSIFYSVHDVLQNCSSFTFSQGINKLSGEIDSGIWAKSYLLSMYNHCPEDFVLFNKPVVLVDRQVFSLEDLSKHSCYMDNSYPLFNSKHSVKQLVENGLICNKSDFSCDDIKRMFCINDDRYERPLSGLGNEIFKAMGAIGVAFNKDIFCFPWLSNRRFEYYHKNITVVLKTLEELNKVVILPLGC